MKFNTRIPDLKTKPIVLPSLKPKENVAGMTRTPLSYSLSLEAFQLTTEGAPCAILITIHHTEMDNVSAGRVTWDSAFCEYE